MHCYLEFEIILLEGYTMKFTSTLLVAEAQNPHSGDEAFKHFIQSHPLAFAAEL